MKNALKNLAWLSGAIGIVMMIVGIIAVVVGGILWDHMWSNYFYPAYNFLLLGIFLFVGILATKETKS
jgi:hypothetical protein